MDEIDTSKTYKLDYSKITNFEDIINILKALNITWHAETVDELEDIKYLLKEED